jgi:hypothetical protein
MKRLVYPKSSRTQHLCQTWGKLYEQGGIEALLFYQKQSVRSSEITEQKHLQIEKK